MNRFKSLLGFRGDSLGSDESDSDHTPDISSELKANKLERKLEKYRKLVKIIELNMTTEDELSTAQQYYSGDISEGLLRFTVKDKDKLRRIRKWDRYNERIVHLERDIKELRNQAR